MFAEYIQAAMERAAYEIIDDPEPFYGRFLSCRAYGPPAKPWKSAVRNSRALLRAG
jgi:hypothetical protein